MRNPILAVSALLFCIPACADLPCPANYIPHGGRCKLCPEGSEAHGDICLYEGGLTVPPGQTGDDDGGTTSSGASAEADAPAVSASDGSAEAMVSPPATPQLDAGMNGEDASANAPADTGTAPIIDACQGVSGCRACAPNPCVNGGVCAESTSGIAACTCPAGYDGPTCARNIDDCVPNPCQNGGTCTDTLNGYSCSCPGNYTGMRCEAEICGDTTIRSAVDLAATRLCKEVRGNLSIVGGATSITGSDLPYLTRVTGNLALTTTAGTTPFLETIILTTLQTIEGSLQIIANNKLASASFPALTSIGRPDATPTFTLQVQQSSIAHLDMPALTTVYGNAQIAVLPNLCSANVRRVTSVTGTVTLLNLINLTYTAIKPLAMFASSSTTTNVGCCTAPDAFMCSSSGTGTCLASCP